MMSSGRRLRIISGSAGWLQQRAWYFSHIFADPKNADTVYVLNTGMYRSGDAGKTFTLLPVWSGNWICMKWRYRSPQVPR